MTSHIEWADWPPSPEEVERQFAKVPPPLELPEEEPPISYVPTSTMGGKEAE